MACFTSTLSTVLTAELDGASSVLGLTSEEILLAALGRAVQRTIGEGFVAVDVARFDDSSYPVALACVGPDRIPATDMLSSVHDSLVALPAQPMVRPVAGDPGTEPISDVLFSFGMPMPRPAGYGHYLEVHAHFDGAAMQLEWWYDPRSFEAYTVEELAEQLPLAMIELTSESTPVATSELAAAY
jgi:hypothetical protein